MLRLSSEQMKLQARGIDAGREAEEALASIENIILEHLKHNLGVDIKKEIQDVRSPADMAIRQFNEATK